ncbi:putative HTH-type transcriptional regulator [Yeosuana aromativorans]|jgi:Rrf2 family protein|uniref:Putative HTH-type transcriptional regulator n=1 Tax=Yeosuana aromativorans TaxID=288019 RepID=A0A8J3BGU8_9FLAO|nr:Rrf2 family transcriptional regulator [Yeosuana aromativorans]GGK13223.1 putative HTH-type transcriptional regulator [Yeosuana aromativorans]
MISNSSKYAIKAVLFLAVHSSEENKIMVKDIAEPINVPQPYIAKLLQELAKRKLISSTRGPKGGFYLSEADVNRNIMEIVHVIDGEKKLNACFLSLEHCNEKNPCPVHHLINASRATMMKNLKGKLIKDLVLDVKNGKGKLPL